MAIKAPLSFFLHLPAARHADGTTWEGEREVLTWVVEGCDMPGYYRRPEEHGWAACINADIGSPDADDACTVLP